VQPTTHEIIVRPAKKGRKPEPVTARLLRTLPHPDRQSNVGVIRFSPDGTRFMMTGYPSGIVQVWDARAWKETARMDTPSGLRGSWDYAVPTPDWKSILVHNMTRKVVSEEKDGKVRQRLQVDGRIDVYETASGKRTRSIPLPDRGPQQLFVVPGGKSVVIMAQGSFSAGGDRPQTTELIDLASAKATKLFDTFSQPAFAPDGKSAYFTTMKYKPGGEFESALVQVDLTSGKVLKTKAPPDRQTYFVQPTLSPDGKRLFVVTGRALKSTTQSLALAMLDSDTLAERGRIAAEGQLDNSSTFTPPLFSPDGRTLLTRSGGPLIVWDMSSGKTVRSVPVGDLWLTRLVLSPDGKRAVLAGMPKYDYRAQARNPDPEDLPQVRLIVIDLTDPKSKPELQIMPSGMFGGVAISPDGTKLAVGSTGGVHLVDLAATK
jgi:WD40 repeat protein